MEGNLPYFTADEMIRRPGMMDILNRYDVPFINYEWLERDENEIPILLRDAQVINVPVPHGHGDYDWDKLPSFDWPLEIGASRHLAGYRFCYSFIVEKDEKIL